ncbi:MAG TPA: hypothetical protein VFB60_12115 [Ktedonobacteraceae bacterium]|nr:hypothetical protein [Ktedonobacteraceae bacterium]
MPSTAQLQKIALLSDTVLYNEAVAFIRKLVKEQDCNPLPASQVNGLLSIAESASYDELYRFVVHQRDRNWPPSKRDIKTFYTALEQELSLMYRKRLKDEFLLLTQQSAQEIRKEASAVMALLAREYIQHLVAENGVLQAEADDKRKQHRYQKQGRR